VINRDVKRRPAAILSADAKGYRHLMEDDELGTIYTLITYREIMPVKRHFLNFF
jgi:hypothetical protein